MIERNENGEIIFSGLDWDLFLGNIFSKCKTEREIEFIENNMVEGVKYQSNLRIKELNEIK